jgi:phosphoribosylformylglycinamidine synthase subunit PurL
VTAAGRGLLAGAHDLSDGGLAVALAEACLASGTGAAVTLPGDPFTYLFSESAARALVAVAPGAEAALTQLCAAAGVPAVALGTAGGDTLDVAGSFSVSLGALSSAHLDTLPVLFA